MDLTPAQLRARRAELPDDGPLARAIAGLQARAGFTMPAVPIPTSPVSPAAVAVARAPLPEIATPAPPAPSAPIAAPPLDVEARREAERSASAWHDAGRALGAVAGAVMEKVRWARGHVWNPKIHEKDIKPHGYNFHPPKNWDRDALAAYEKKRPEGYLLASTFKAMADTWFKYASDGRGYVWHALAWLAMKARYGKESARKFIRWCEDNGWLGTLNTLCRDEDGNLRRGFNVYILFDKETAAEIAAVEDPEARARKREARTLSRGVRLWPGLVIRPWGLNATPSPSNRHQAHPAPA